MPLGKHTRTYYTPTWSFLVFKSFGEEDTFDLIRLVECEIMEIMVRLHPQTTKMLTNFVSICADPTWDEHGSITATFEECEPCLG